MLTRRREERLTGILDYAKAVAAGKEVDPDTLLAVLHRANTSDDDFTALVDLIRRRAELRKTAAGVDAATAESDSIERKIEAQQAAIEETLRKLEAALTPLRIAYRAAQDKLVTCRSAAESLVSIPMLPKSLADRREAARRDHITADSECRVHEESLARGERELADATVRLGGAGRLDAAVQSYRDDAARSGLDAQTFRVVESVISARRRIADANRVLPPLIEARDAARAEYEAAVQACRDF
jgi:hypothetical protein